MKVLFLDVDGVLNAWGEEVDYSHYHRYDGDVDRWELGFFFPDLVQQLNRVTDATGAVIVVSSTWRLSRTVEQLRKLFKEVGITGEVFGKTGNGNDRDDSWPHGGLRGIQIQQWLNEHCNDTGRFPESFAIVDDDNDMAHLQDRFVLTKTSHGLTADAADKLIALLKPA